MDFLNALKSVVTSIKNWVNEKLKKKVDVVEGKGLSTNDLTDDLLDKINSFDESIAAAKKAGDDAQTEVDALETKVGNIPDGSKATTVIGYINEKTENTTSDSAMQELANRVTELEKQVSGNLLKAPITVATNVSDELIFTFLDYSLNLEVGKSYKVSGTYGVNNNTFNKDVECIDIEGMNVFMLSMVEEDEGIDLYFYDKTTKYENEDPVHHENASMFVVPMVTEAYVPFTLNSITLVEEASNGNLLSAPITHSESIEDTAVLNLDFSVGIEDGKSYTFKGTHGIANTPFEVTVLADKPNDSDFTKMLTDERQGLIVAIVYTDETEEVGLGAIILDKCYIDFDNEISEYNENKATVLLQTLYSPDEEHLMIPFTITSITEAQVEYATVSYVDNIIAEINDKLEALLNGTEE